MEPMPIPNRLTLFIMVGNQAAELAGNIVNAVKDHVSEEGQLAISSFALVDDSFEEKKAVVDNVFYRFKDDAVSVAIEKILNMNETLNQKDIAHIQLNKVNCVFIADASGDIPLDKVVEIAKAIQKGTDKYSIDCGAFLCLLTDYRMAGNQHAWLMRNNQLHEDMNLFRKTLLLSTKDFHGSVGERVKQNMRDAVTPAILLMLNGHELNDANKLYTAAYSKNGGTSNDILELKRHIAAEVLDGFFANENRIGDVWKFLSLPNGPDLTNGYSVAERVQAAAERYMPSLACFAATADLDDKYFDPVVQVMAFEELNGKMMCESDIFPDGWKENVVEKAKESISPDALLAQLNEDSAFYKDILAHCREYNLRRKELESSDWIKKLLESVEIKKGLFTQRRDYNLQALGVTVDRYHLLCKERFALCILTYLKNAILDIRRELKACIEQRKSILANYKRKDDEVAVLMDENMCGRAAAMLRTNYATTPIDTLNAFLQYADRLYGPNSEQYWHRLFKEFVATSKQGSRFADAFMQGKDPHGLIKGVEKLAEKLYPLIPDYPDTLGPLPQPSVYYLLNTAIADQLVMKDALVYGVPGDVIESMALYRLGCDYAVLEQFKLFSDGPLVGNFHAASAIQYRKAIHAAKMSEDEKIQHPLGLRAKEVEDGIQLTWKFADHDAAYSISADDELVEALFDHKAFILNGMMYLIHKKHVKGKRLRVTLTDGQEKDEVIVNLKQCDQWVDVVQTKVKAKSGEWELCRCKAEFASEKYLVIREAKQTFRVPLLKSDPDGIGPLWLPENVHEIELADMD